MIIQSLDDRVTFTIELSTSVSTYDPFTISVILNNNNNNNPSQTEQNLPETPILDIPNREYVQLKEK